MHRECSTKRPTDLDDGDEAEHVQKEEELTARALVWSTGLGVVAIVGEAGAPAVRVCVGVALVPALLGLLLRVVGYRDVAGARLVLPRHLALLATGYRKGKRRGQRWPTLEERGVAGLGGEVRQASADLGMQGRLRERVDKDGRERGGAVGRW